jgi:hypothetical protein
MARLSDEIVQQALAQVAEDKRVAEENLVKIVQFLRETMSDKIYVDMGSTPRRAVYLYCDYDPEPAWVAFGDSFIMEVLVPEVSAEPVKVEIHAMKYDSHAIGA